MTRPLHQRIFYWSVYLLIGYALAGTFLDATSNAISIVSPKLGIILAIIVLVLWASTEILLKTRSLSWLSKEGQRVQLRALGTKTRLAVIGVAALLLVPLVTKSIKNSQRLSLTRVAVTDREAESAERKDSQRKEAENTSLPLGPLDSHSQAQRHVDDALELYGKAKYEDAIKECDEALRLDPQNQEAAKLKEHINVSLEISKRNQKP